MRSVIEYVCYLVWYGVWRFVFVVVLCVTDDVCDGVGTDSMCGDVVDVTECCSR